MGTLMEYQHGENKLLKTDFIFEVSFEDIEGKPYPAKRYKFEPQPLWGTFYSEPAEQKIAKSLEKIANSTRDIVQKLR